MATRCLRLPYKASNPRSVRGARRQGWAVVKSTQVMNREGKPMTHIALNIWCERYCSGYWLSSFYLSEFAFENLADATLFKLKWG